MQIFFKKNSFIFFIFFIFKLQTINFKNKKIKKFFITTLILSPMLFFINKGYKDFKKYKLYLENSSKNALEEAFKNFENRSSNLKLSSFNKNLEELENLKKEDCQKSLEVNNILSKFIEKNLKL